MVELDRNRLHLNDLIQPWHFSARLAAAERCVDYVLALSGPCSAAECAAAPRLPLPAEQLRPDMPLCDDTEGRRLH